MIGPYSFWQAAMLIRSNDLDDMRDALADDGPHDVLGHKKRRSAGPGTGAHRAEMPRSANQSAQS